MTHTIAMIDPITSDPTEPFQTLFEEGMLILMARMTKAELEVEQELELEEPAMEEDDSACFPLLAVFLLLYVCWIVPLLVLLPTFFSCSSQLPHLYYDDDDDEEDDEDDDDDDDNGEIVVVDFDDDDVIIDNVVDDDVVEDDVVDDDGDDDDVDDDDVDDDVVDDAVVDDVVFDDFVVDDDNDGDGDDDGGDVHDDVDVDNDDDNDNDDDSNDRNDDDNDTNTIDLVVPTTRAPRCPRRQPRRAAQSTDVEDWTSSLEELFEAPLLRRSSRLASKPRVDYRGTCR